MVISKIYNIFGENKLLKTSCLYFKLTTGIIRYYILIPLFKQWIFAHWDYLYHSLVSAILTRMKNSSFTHICKKTCEGKLSTESPKF